MGPRLQTRLPEAEAAAHRCRRSDGLAGRPPMAAFTATATPEVRDDIVELLGLAEPRIVVAGFDRPNIYPSAARSPASTKSSTCCRVSSAIPRPGLHGHPQQGRGCRRRLCRPPAFEPGVPRRDGRRRADARCRSGSRQGTCASSARPTRSAWASTGRISTRSFTWISRDRSRPTTRRLGAPGRDGRPARATLLWNYADVKTREFLIDRGQDEEAGGREAANRPCGTRTAQGTRAQEAAAHGGLRGHDRRA